MVLIPARKVTQEDLVHIGYQNYKLVYCTVTAGRCWKSCKDNYQYTVRRTITDKYKCCR